jgi:Mn-dependent DtxR family transcriptional regulator
VGSASELRAAHYQFREEKMNETQILSASNIRYLIALNALDKEGGIRCVDIAEELGVTRPSVHRMVEMLCDRDLVKQAKYGMVFLTKEGRELAARYAEYYDIVCGFLCQKLTLPPEDSKNAAFALLAGIPDERIENMCEIMRNAS